MWKKIIDDFNAYPSQQKVVRKLLELGLRVDENKKIYCKDVEINISSLAKSINTDRRVITSTINNILKDDEKRKLFMNLYPAGPVLSKLSGSLDIDVIDVEASGDKPGLLSQITKILANENIVIRQAYASDSELDVTPHLTIITDKTSTDNIARLLLEIDGVYKVSLY